MMPSGTCVGLTEAIQDNQQANITLLICTYKVFMVMDNLTGFRSLGGDLQSATEAD
jgi:hypothetical protein